VFARVVQPWTVLRGISGYLMRSFGLDLSPAGRLVAADKRACAFEAPSAFSPVIEGSDP